ncbi:MoaD/ThiS family protein [Archangium gephyra]|uniref:ubiquitin-like small modifier protein 1 n=1 Tax=Archangium gephyra TaxID=48 RepID=UPI0035D4D2B8
MATIRIPTTMRGLTGNKGEVRVAGATVGEVLKNLEQAHPGMGARVFDDKGAVRRYVNVFLNDEDIRFLQELSTPVAEGDRITLIPAIAGG